MDVFSALKPGLVAVAQVGSGSAGTIKVSGSGGELSAIDSVVITDIKVNQRVNLQYSPALNSNTYVYGFGDGIGHIRVSGITFSRMCEGSGDGLAQVLKFYAGSRAVDDVTCNVSLGGSAFSGFLEEVEAGMDNPELQMGSYTLSMSTLPSMMRM